MSSFKKKSIISAFWVLAGYGGSQFIRLCSNLILTRLLAPELFGLMAVVNSVITGVMLLSDIGVRDSLINNKDSHEGYFLRTAWTINLIRGALIYLIICLLAFPMEGYFGYENLGLLLIVCGSSALIAGATSLNLDLVGKQLNFKPLVINELVSAVFGAIVMIACALVVPSVWSLAIGMVAHTICSVVLSYIVLPGERMGFGMNLPIAKNIFNYGKWIFLSTATTYIASHGDKLILAKNISAKELGIYSIGAVFGFLLKEVASNFSGRFLFPLFRKAVEEEISMVTLLKSRWVVIGGTFIAALLLSALAELIITTLYDERYHGAGWILQFMAFAGLFHTLDDSIRHFINVNNDSFRSFCIQGLKAIVFLVLAISLSYEYGILGIIIALAITPILVYPYLMYATYLYGYRWQYLDALAIILMIASFLLLWKMQSSILWGKLLELASTLA